MEIIKITKFIYLDFVIQTYTKFIKIQQPRG